MKQKILMLIIIQYLFSSVLFAQNIEKMNKAELKDQLGILTNKIDSLTNENKNLQESIRNLSILEEKLKEKNKINEIEISRISSLIRKNENEKNQLISENNIIITRLNETIISLKDSISSIQSTSNILSDSKTQNGNDFLNTYYFDQFPLNNNSFNLVLRKVIYGNVKTKDGYGYDYNNSNKELISLPEILNSNEIEYWGVKPDVFIRSESSFNEYVFSTNSDYFNLKLPKIEILKNKLVTFFYPDGSEESFLFNVNNGTDLEDNNQRNLFQIELASEGVKSDNSNSKENDIVWRFYVIENECYLALTQDQLKRLKIPLIKGIDVYIYSGEKRNISTDFKRINDNTYKTTGEGIYLSRKKDVYMEGSRFINTENLIYLFKFN